MGSMSSAQLTCDYCDYKQPVEVESIPDWHNEMCPACGKGPIIDDEDIDAYHRVQALLQLDTFLARAMGLPEEDKKTVRFHSKKGVTDDE